MKINTYNLIEVQELNRLKTNLVKGPQN